MSKSDELKKLFACWVEKHEKYKGKFTADGIADESVYDEQNPKLLFLCKEENNPDQEGRDFRDWFFDSFGQHDHLRRRICQWAFGIQNKFPSFETVKEKLPNDEAKLKVLKSVAFMNLKKIGGDSLAKDEQIRAAVENEHDLIKEEIEIINPDVIIGGIGDHSLWKVIFPGIQFCDPGRAANETGFDTSVARAGSHKVISFYHPSYRVPDAVLYYLLRNVCQGEPFQKL
ncbi:MAG: hypothetical protein MPL62_14980 [Alphaproteobacteria bacterium]|nr:hypothetical protein [Alphaproteobacteria bacterium]